MKLSHREVVKSNYLEYFHEWLASLKTTMLKANDGFVMSIRDGNLYYFMHPLLVVAVVGLMKRLLNINFLQDSGHVRLAFQPKLGSVRLLWYVSSWFISHQMVGNPRRDRDVKPYFYDFFKSISRLPGWPLRILWRGLLWKPDSVGRLMHSLFLWWRPLWCKHGGMCTMSGQYRGAALWEVQTLVLR